MGPRSFGPRGPGPMGYGPMMQGPMGMGMGMGPRPARGGRGMGFDFPGPPNGMMVVSSAVVFPHPGLLEDGSLKQLCRVVACLALQCSRCTQTW